MSRLLRLFLFAMALLAPPTFAQAITGKDFPPYDAILRSAAASCPSALGKLADGPNEWTVFCSEPVGDGYSIATIKVVRLDSDYWLCLSKSHGWRVIKRVAK